MRRFTRRFVGVLSVLVFFALWELSARLGLINPLFISSPVAIFYSTIALTQDGTLGHYIWVSATEFIIGYSLAAVVGIPMGMAMGRFRLFDDTTKPFVSALYATPRIALVPMIMLWFGIALGAKVVIVFLGAVFPIIINTKAGIVNVDQSLVRAARSFGASERQIFTTVGLPGSLPFMLTGLRLAVGTGLIGMIVAELYASNAGIGYLIVLAGQTFQLEKAFVGVFVITVSSVFLISMLERVEQRYSAWRPKA